MPKPTPGMRGAQVLCLVVALCAASVALASPEQDARAFLTQQHLNHALKGLDAGELAALGRTLKDPNRRLADKNLAGLLRNPAAWETRGNARQLLGTILKSLPTIAGIKGINQTMKLASNNDATNFRGYGVEMIGAAALNRFVTVDGQRATVTRMGGMVKGIDGRMRESDGAAMLGADGVPRMVTIKSVSTEGAVGNSMRKAADQLALRNIQRDGTRRPGVILVGYDSPEVYNKLRRKNWQAAADRTGAKLLVLGINQLTGANEKLASYSPDPNSTIKPKRPGPRPSWGKRLSRFMMKQIGKRHPPTARKISHMRGAVKRYKQRLGQKIRTLFGRKTTRQLAAARGSR